MRARQRAVPLGLVSAVVGISVLVAGCLAQDRPREPSFTIIADAGGAVVAVGAMAHLAWTQDQAIEAEKGEGPAEPADIDWQASSGAHATGPSFDFTPGSEFVLVELNVTAENHSAHDLGAVLSVPASGSGWRAYIGVVGDVELQWLGGAFAADTPVSWHGHKGHYYSTSTVDFDVRLRIVQGPNGGQAAFLISVKAPTGYANVTATQPLHFEGGVNYTLSLDAHNAANHRVGVSGADPPSVLLSEFVQSNGGEAEGRVVIAPAGQSLPGMDAAAAVVAVGAASVLALVRRRR